MPRDLSGQIIVITGASSGIGAATAVACAKAGMDVALGGRRPEKLEEVAAQVRGAGRRALCVPGDVDKDADVEQLVAKTLETFGRLDVAFANAGYGINKPVMETTDAQMRAIFETNFHGTLRLIRAAVPVMGKAGRGHVLVCSSAASEIAPPGYGAYSATKAAQDMVACALRAELAGQGIFVTSVHPVGTATGFLDRVAQEAGRPMSSNTPGGFQQTPDDVARAIVRCIRRPRAEVWPMPVARFALAAATALPGPAAWFLARHARKRKAPESK